MGNSFHAGSRDLPGALGTQSGHASPSLASKHPSRLWSLAPWAIFVLSVVTKLVLIVPYAHAPAGLDELTFLALAKILRVGEQYPALHYPPLYPLSLVPATLFPEIYRAAIVLGCIYSSALILPMWLIARDLFDERRAAAVALVAALMPFQYAMSRVAMSETLFYPLLMTAVYLAVTSRWKRLVLRDALLGVAIAALFLTRYLGLVFVPALALAWFMRERERNRTWYLERDVWIRLGLVVGSAAAVLMVWAGIAVLNDFSLGEILQVRRVAKLSAASTLPDEALTLERFGRFALAYLSSWALWLAPALGLMVLALVQLVKRGSLDLRARITAVFLASAVPLLYVVTRWAWRAQYNWPEVLRIMDRYCIYLVALGLLVALGAIGLSDSSARIRSGWGFWVLTVALPLGILAGSWWLVFKSGFLPGLDIKEPGLASADTYHVRVMGAWFWFVAAAGLLACAWAGRRERSRSFAVVAISLTLFFAIGLPTYVSNSMRVPVAQAHAEQLSRAIQRQSPAEGESVTVWISGRAGTVSKDDRLARHVRVRLRWMLHDSKARIVVQLKRPKPASEGLILMAAEEPRLPGDDVLTSYDAEGKHFVIVQR